MTKRAVAIASVLLTLGRPAVCSAQIYAGAVVGVGAAKVPVGSSYGGGLRGLLRLFGGYAFTRHLAAEAMTFDLGKPGNRPRDDSTIGAFAVAARGTLPVKRLAFNGRVGVMSMDARAFGTTTRTGQAMVSVGIDVAVARKLAVGLETASSRARFGPPLDRTVQVIWTGLAITYRF
jgi:hypothetical protein